MTNPMKPLIDDMRTYCALMGIAKPSVLCSRAVDWSGLWKRLEAGHECRRATEARIRQYMADNPPPGGWPPKQDEEEPSEVAA